MLLQLTWNLLQEVKHLNIRDFCCIYKYTWCVSIVTTFLKCDAFIHVHVYVQDIKWLLKIKLAICQNFSSVKVITCMTPLSINNDTADVFLKFILQG